MLAPEGHVWVCAACGKVASDCIKGGLSSGWDESCFLHAHLVAEADIQERDRGGRVRKIKDDAVVKHRSEVCDE